ncbi:divergent protein kinase domain 1C isoform X1 [Hyla sarda]|uniref:divergent protein kinase domain 1C isoform X1 n=1 Tax=Hyla sarda TaxID=327740 RepID=UPI0024C36F92|nr:divergent protein kinase domain 1C isoform X1 [Hyla sarda]
MRIFPGKWLKIKICKKNTFLLLLFWASCWILVSTFLFVHRSMFSDRCTDEESKKILAGLCYDYNNRAVTGDLCEDLCVTEKLMYKHCLYYQRGKKVLQADWQGTSIILKSKNDAFSSFQPPIFLDESDAQSLTDTELFVMVAVEIKNTLGLDLPNSTLLPLWPERKDSQNWKVDLASMWSLYQQEEYLLFNLLQDFSRHVLRVVGTCGHFYAVEFLSAGLSWKQNLFPLEEVVGHCKTGEEKMKALLDIAISFLDMVHQFDNEFSHRLHLCDVKPENFAIRSDLTVVAIDMDMAFFEPKMRNILEQKCTSDKDCNFFDCFSTCDLKTFMCGAERENSNLQVICDKIFRRWFTQSIMGSIRPFPLQAELHEAVQKCAESTNLESLFTDLYSLLQKSQKQLHRGNV